jgi:hypothetical protein
MVQFLVRHHAVSTNNLAFIDWVANGSLCGDGMLVLAGSERFVHASGLRAAIM